MLDDAASGVTVRHNNFSASENVTGAGPNSLKNVSICMNGGSYNLFAWNTYPENSDTVFRGYQTVRDIVYDGANITGGILGQVGVDFVPIPDHSGPPVDWKFAGSEWTTPFQNSAGFFNGSGSDYYGGDWVVTGSQTPFVWEASGSSSVLRLKKAFWFDVAAVKARWFVVEPGQPIAEPNKKHFLNCRGNKVAHQVSASAFDLTVRKEGHIADTSIFSNPLTFYAGTPPSLIQ